MGTAAYTPERADEQWRQIRDTYMATRVARGCDAIDVDKALAHQEALRRPTIAKRHERWARRQLNDAWGAPLDATEKLLRHFERTLGAWNRRRAQDIRRQMRVQEQDRKAFQRRKRKQGWDGREAFADFERRVHARNG